MIRALGALALAAFLVTAFTPLTSWLDARALARVENRPADAIVVLGASVASDGTLSPASLQRTAHGVLLFKKGLAPLIVFSGSRLPGGPAEAEVRAHIARQFGVPAGAIITESDVQTTRDEARRIGATLTSRGARRILLVSEGLHLTRARPLFERAGLEVYTSPSDGARGRSLDPENRVWAMRALLSELAAEIYARLL